MAQPLIHIAAPPAERASLGVARREHLVAASATAVLLTCAGAARGSYFPGSWGWLTVACAWGALLALVLDRQVAVGGVARWTLAAWTALTAWTLASTIWSADVTQTVLEAQRTLVYVAAFAAAVLLARRAPAALLAGAAAAATGLCLYALGTRLLPDRFGVVDGIGGFRLSEPIGYWNSLGLLAGMGALLALGLAARSRSLAGRAVAAAPLPLLLATLFFTFSRGAWGATAIGLALAVAVDRRRLQLLAVSAAVGPWAAAAVYLASRQHGLTTVGTPLAAQVREGHHLVLPLLGLALGAAASAAALAWLEPLVSLPAHAVRATEATLVALVAAAAIAGMAAYGSPWHIADRGWHAFASQPPATGTNLEGRLFHLSSNGRLDQWKVAWTEVKEHPAVGSGAGTFERFWNRDRPYGGKVRDVHNLYLESLAELGPLGAALLALALGLPLVAALRRRGEPFVPPALAAYVAFLVHAAVDWDWEIASVTLVAVLCAASFCVGGAERRPLGQRARLVGGGLAVAVALIGFYGLVMQTTLSHIDGSPTHAARAARRAADVQPWSTEPWRRLATVDANARRYGDARVALRRALAKDGGDWSLWFALAQTSDGRERANAMSRAGALDPRSPELAAFRRTLVSLSGIEGAK